METKATIVNFKENYGYKKLTFLHKKVSALEKVNTVILGGMTLMFLLFSFPTQLLWIFKVKTWLHGPLLFFVELLARILAAFSILLALLTIIIRIRYDKFRKLAWHVNDLFKETNTLPFNFLDQPDYVGRMINKDSVLSEMTALTQMGTTAYRLNNIDQYTRLNRFKIWYGTHPKTFIAFTNHNSDIIGYMSILPLDKSEGYGNAHYTGKLDEFELDKIAISKKSTTLILCQGFWLDPNALGDINALKVFVDCFYKQLASFMYLDEKHIQETIIYCEPVTFYNRKLFESLGFVKTIRKSKSGRNLYELKFDENIGESRNGYISKVYVLLQLDTRRRDQKNADTQNETKDQNVVISPSDSD